MSFLRRDLHQAPKRTSLRRLRLGSCRHGGARQETGAFRSGTETLDLQPPGRGPSEAVSGAAAPVSRPTSRTTRLPRPRREPSPVSTGRFLESTYCQAPTGRETLTPQRPSRVSQGGGAALGWAGTPEARGAGSPRGHGRRTHPSPHWGDWLPRWACLP